MSEPTDNVSDVLDLDPADQVAPEATSSEDDTIDTDAGEVTSEQSESNDSTNDGGDTGDNTNSNAPDVSEAVRFLQNKGIDPANPDPDKLVEMAMNAEQKMFEALNNRDLEQQVAQPTQLNPSDTVALAEVRGLQMQMAARDFKERTNLSQDDEMKMVEYLNKPIQTADGRVVRKLDLVGSGELSLDEVYKLAVGVTERAEVAKENLRKATLKDIATSRNAKRPVASATNGTQFGSQDEEDAYTKGLDSLL
jgi:hypothetical protein